MGWILVSLSSAAVSGILSIIDKKVLTNFLPNVGSFGLLLSLMSIISGILIIWIVPQASYVENNIKFLAALGGFIWGSGLLVYFHMLRIEEVSRTSPVFHTYPAIVAVLGVSFLDEHLSITQLFAVMMTITGAILISTKITGSGIFNINKSTFTLLMLASLLAAIGQLTNKYVLDNAPFWTIFGFRNIGIAIPFLVFLSKDNLSGLINGMRHPVGRYVLIFGEIIYATFSVWLALVAVNMGPVSIVTALIGTRPAFIFIYSIILSKVKFNILDEPITKEIILSKAIAITLVVLGVSTIILL